MLTDARAQYSRLQHVWVDQCYAGSGRTSIEAAPDRRVVVVRHAPGSRGRWVPHGDLRGRGTIWSHRGQAWQQKAAGDPAEAGSSALAPARKGGTMSATETEPWVAQLFATIESMDPDAVAAYFADDGSFRFGNAAPARGHGAIRAAAAAFFGEIGGLRHRTTGVWSGRWERGRVLAIESEVTYTRRDGTQTPSLPVTSTLRMEGDLIKDYRIFMDISPLFTAH